MKRINRFRCRDQGDPFSNKFVSEPSSPCLNDRAQDLQSVAVKLNKLSALNTGVSLQKRRDSVVLFDFNF